MVSYPARHSIAAHGSSVSRATDAENDGDATEPCVPNATSTLPSSQECNGATIGWQPAAVFTQAKIQSAMQRRFKEHLSIEAQQPAQFGNASVLVLSTTKRWKKATPHPWVDLLLAVRCVPSVRRPQIQVGASTECAPCTRGRQHKSFPAPLRPNLLCGELVRMMKKTFRGSKRCNNTTTRQDSLRHESHQEPNFRAEKKRVH